MKNLEIIETKQTPYVLCDTEGTVRIEGRSFPNNTINFYIPIIEWAKKFRSEKLDIHIKLDYFNTSTCKQLLSILQLFVRNHTNKEVLINWYYEEDDEDTLEIGQHYDMAINAPFKFIQYNNEKNIQLIN